MAAEASGELVTFGRDLLLERIGSAKERVWLAGPFLTLPIAQRIAEAAERSGVSERKLLTALVARSVQVGVLDTEALEHLHDADFEISSIANLHAKVSLVDSSWGLIGSGNLTGAGLGGSRGGNHELGVLLDEAQAAAAYSVMARWWRKAKTVGPEEIERYAGLPKLARSPIGDFGPSLPVPEVTGLAQILAEDATTAASRSYWVDANYHNPADESWWRRNWISGPRRASYQVGDLIFIYLTKRSGGPGACAAAVQATTACRKDRQWVIDHRDEEAAEQWPFVTETSFVAEIPAFPGVDLDVIGKSGMSVQGHCSLTRPEFERIAREMLAAAVPEGG
ncbi:MAG TPA: phospholipase D-like domain-containing protein [Solirubrobacterales bacterium]|nr:phospholipase D-like domain-containing protein [Solirubrobacterales bacterium]